MLLLHGIKSSIESNAVARLSKMEFNKGLVLITSIEGVRKQEAVFL